MKLTEERSTLVPIDHMEDMLTYSLVIKKTMRRWTHKKQMRFLKAIGLFNIKIPKATRKRIGSRRINYDR